MVAHTRRISPWSGLNVGTAMPCARPVRPAWSEPSPEARSSTSSLYGGGLRTPPRGDQTEQHEQRACAAENEWRHPAATTGALGLEERDADLRPLERELPRDDQ